MRSYRAGLRSPGRVFAHSVRALRLDSRVFKNAIRAGPFQSESLAGLVRKLRSVHEQQKRFTRTKNQNVVRKMRSFQVFLHAIVNLIMAWVLTVHQNVASEPARRNEPVDNGGNLSNTAAPPKSAW